MRRKNEATKRLQGTARADRLRRVGPLPMASGRCPADLSEGARRHWRRLAPKLRRAGRLAATDVDALADLCLCRHRRDRIEETLELEGLSVEGYRGGMVKNPLCSVLKTYRDAIARYETKFGLTPLDREALGVPEQPAEDLDLVLLSHEYADLKDPGSGLPKRGDDDGKNGGDSGGDASG